MFSLGTFVTFVQQIARLVPAPSARLPGRRHGSDKARLVRDCCGICPFRREFVVIRSRTSGAPFTCPRCGRSVDSLDPPGPA